MYHKGVQNQVAFCICFPSYFVLIIRTEYNSVRFFCMCCVCAFVFYCCLWLLGDFIGTFPDIFEESRTKKRWKKKLSRTLRLKCSRQNQRVFHPHKAKYMDIIACRTFLERGDRIGSLNVALVELWLLTRFLFPSVWWVTLERDDQRGISGIYGGGLLQGVAHERGFGGMMWKRCRSRLGRVHTRAWFYSCFLRGVDLASCNSRAACRNLLVGPGSCLFLLHSIPRDSLFQQIYQRDSRILYLFVLFVFSRKRAATTLLR